jgi:adenosylhomocysteine nucleosidase
VILICAATRTEATACPGGPGLEVLRTGVGPERAAAALRRRLARGVRPALVVSSGFAGALPGPLPLHGCITATELLRLEAGRVVPVALAPGALRVLPGAARCAVLSAVAVTRAAPPCPSATAVDMESAALAEVAAGAGIPFAVLRVISDTAAAPFPAFVADLAAAMASGAPGERLRAATRAVAAGVRSPGAVLSLVRSSLASRRALAAAWRSARGSLEPSRGAQASLQ